MPLLDRARLILASLTLFVILLSWTNRVLYPNSSEDESEGSFPAGYASRPKRINIEPLHTHEAKWVSLKKITWQDPLGVNRIWESAERTTRGRGARDIDAVGVLALLTTQDDSLPLSMIVIEQYRPSLDRIVVELPGGLIDPGETVEQTALREFREEVATDLGDAQIEVLRTSPMLTTDPGMTNQVIQLVVLSIVFPSSESITLAKPNLTQEEFIEKRIVPISNLTEELHAYSRRQDYIVDAGLYGLALGHSVLG